MKIGRCPDCLAWQARYDALLTNYHALRMLGASPLLPAKITPPPEPTEERALRRAHDEFVPQIAKQFEMLGHSSASALKEAERIRASIDQPFAMGGE